MTRRHWAYKSAMLGVFALSIVGTVYFATRPPRPTVDLPTAIGLNNYTEIEKNLKYGTDVNVSANGMTPLFVTALKQARFAGLDKSVAFLFAHGARD